MKKRPIDTTKSKKIPSRNQSPFGWWVASYVMRAVWHDNPNPSPRSRCKAWENTIVFKAKNREAAYKKAMRIASSNCASEFSEWEGTNTGHWILEGLTSLFPIYGRLEDGVEILWTEFENRSVAKIRSFAKAKHQLDVFDDSPMPEQ